MKERKSFFGKILNKDPRNNIEIKVDLVEFEENSIFFTYSPALDLIGYGNTRPEARESWETVLEEYFRYAINKKTLLKDLENHGWCVVKKGKQFKPPTFTWMLQHNHQLNEMYNNHNFQKTTTPITLPLQQAYA